jgi:hypothetical protein
MNNRIASIVLASLALSALSSCRKEVDILPPLAFQGCTSTSTRTTTSARLASPGDVTPIFEREMSCYFPSTQTCRLVFSYSNSADPTSIPVGRDNHFQPPNDRSCSGSCGQPTQFGTGLVKPAFMVQANTLGAYAWQLDGHTAAGECDPGNIPTCTILPVNFVSVSGKWDGERSIRMSWKVADESQVSEYRVYMALPCTGNPTALVGSVPAAHNGASGQFEYSSAPIYVDRGGDYLLRVVEVDQDGHEKMSSIVKVRVGN